MLSHGQAKYYSQKACQRSKQNFLLGIFCNHKSTLFFVLPAVDAGDGSLVGGGTLPRIPIADIVSSLSQAGAATTADSPAAKSGPGSRDSGCYASNEHLKKVSGQGK